MPRGAPPMCCVSRRCRAHQAIGLATGQAGATMTGFAIAAGDHRP
jgi:hypothetical protein